MGVALEEASEQDVAAYLALTDLPYKEVDIKERLDDPLFLEIQAVTTEGLPGTPLLNVTLMCFQYHRGVLARFVDSSLVR